MDKKSQHVGNHGGRYVDNDGQTKQFTYIDHDKKTKISRHKMSDEEVEALKQSIKQQNLDRIEEILIFPAINALSENDHYVDQALYGEFLTEVDDEVVWNEAILRAACEINHELCRNLHLRVWRNTVSEANWFTELTHEEVMAGKWEELI